MKRTQSILASILCLGYGVFIAMAQSTYADVCTGYKSRYNQRVTIDETYTVALHCESQVSLPDTFHLAGTAVNDAEACARLCRDDPHGCQGAVWSHKLGECWVSHTKEGGRIIDAPGLLYMDPNDNIAGLQQCKDEQAQLQADLDECKKNAIPDESSGEKCPFVDLSTVNVSSKNFKVYCKRLDDYGGANIRILTAANAHACIQACTTTDGCTRAVWQSKATMSEATVCWLRDYSKVDKVPTVAGGGYSSAHLQ